MAFLSLFFLVLPYKSTQQSLNFNQTHEATKLNSFLFLLYFQTLQKVRLPSFSPKACAELFLCNCF